MKIYFNFALAAPKQNTLYLAMEGEQRETPASHPPAIYHFFYDDLVDHVELWGAVHGVGERLHERQALALMS